MVKHCEAVKRRVAVVNLDPAAEVFDYEPVIDIRELISLEDAMESMGLGPNGGLVYCLEYLVENMDWFMEKIDDYADDYLIFDCPGQIELYTHLPIMRTVIRNLQRVGYNLCAVYMMDSILITDASRFMAGVLMSLSVMAQLEIPHISVLSKCDLVRNKRALDAFLDPSTDALLAALNDESHEDQRPLNEAMAELIENYSMVSFKPLDVTDEESIGDLLLAIDMCTQYGEDVEPNDPDEGKPDDAAGPDGIGIE